MRQRIKQTLSREKKGKFFLRRKPNTNLLHSDKSIYFYKRLNYSSTVPLVLASLALLLALGCMVNPVAGSIDKTSAVAEQDYGAGRKISLSIINNGNALADDDTVSTEVTVPGTISYISNTLRINTSQIAKYYVGVQAAMDGNSNLTGTTHGEVITGVGSNVLPSDFSDNTWGYVLTDNTSTSDNTLAYSTLPTYDTNSPLQYTSAANPSDGNHDLKLTFAAKINANKPADHYTTKAMVSVAADAKALTLSDITYMQDMMPDICANSPEHQTKQLIDKRDNKSYWVTKLKDNHCWMTQNLDLDLDGRTLTPEDSDVTTNWVSSTGAPELWLATNAEGIYDPTLVKYYDPGTYVENTPNELDICGGTVDDLAGIEDITNCADNGIINVTNMTASSDPDFGDEITDNTYNAHYLLGNYYSWPAAVANDTTAANQSICAKGWALPNSYNQAGYVNLLKAYGYTWSDPAAAEGSIYIRAYAELSGEGHGGKHTYVTNSPMYFPHSGLVYNGKMYYLSSSGIYYTKEVNRTNPSPNDGPYRFDVYGFIAAYSQNAVWDGLQIRCVAK